MQKILIISNVFPLDKNPSRGCYILAQAKLLISAGYDVKVVNPLPFIPPFFPKLNKKFQGLKNLKKHKTIENIDVFHPRYLCFPGTMFPNINQKLAKRMASKIYKWIEDWDPDIIHLHSIHPLLKVGEFVAKKLDVPFFITVHGWDFDVGINNKKIYNSIVKISSNISGICVVNNNHLDIARRIIKEQKSHYIPCHIDIKLKYHRKINNFDFKNKKIKLLFPANPSRREKNYSLFLNTIKKLEKKGWEIEKDYLKNDSRKKTIQKFHWADLVLLTSKREGGPLVTKEAIFCGSRVVSTPVGDSSLWLPSNSVSKDFTSKSLVKSIESALKNDVEVWKIPKHFEAENVLKKLIELYQIN
tara:strand:- start:4603 stop:5676 length:1074 start_codon:yes stop_codon:yes gene_type:complete